VHSVKHLVPILALLLAGCLAPAPKVLSQKESSLRLTAVGFADLPGWQQADVKPAFAAFLKSCEKKASAPQNADMGGMGYAGTADEWREACAMAAGWQDQEKLFFEQVLTPFRAGNGSADEGLFTGYYEPDIAVSHTRHGPYQTPIYGLPGDLLTVDLGAFREEWKGKRIVGRIAGKKLVPYATRAEIAKNTLSDAPVLFYAADPVMLFFLQIQGSGRAHSDDGQISRLVYAGQNGHAYTAIGQVLIERGVLTKEHMSLGSIRDWLRIHPDEADGVMNADESYVFFKNEPLADPAIGAKGSEGVPLTAGASIAVDTHYHALGVPFFVATHLADGTPFNRLTVAQDTGGAIRGVVRADIYFGAGERAEAEAGAMKQPGSLYVLLPKPPAKPSAAKNEEAKRP
jgi:membrane-bound lytic murein transglycosylase A